MAMLSWEQTAREAFNAGFRNVDLIIITAIAYAESTLNPSATNHVGLGHYGLLQFDPPTAKQAGYSTAAVMNPQTAFKAAYNLVYGVNGSPKRGFQPWKNDGHEAYMRKASEVVMTTLGLEANSGNARTTGSEFTGGDTGNAWTDPNPANWGREVGSSLTSGLNNIGPNIANALMDAGRSMLPYLVILAVLLFGAVLVYSGVVKQEARAVTGGLAGGN